MLTKNRLGRGLEALIPKTISDNTPKINNLHIKQIKPNPRQPRLRFKEEELTELSESIIEHGVIQPIIVRKKGDTYELVAGERRLRASEMAKKKTIPAIIIKISDKESGQIALIENILRKDLNSVEIAYGYEKLMLEHALNHEAIAKIFSKKRSSITNTLRLLQLPQEIIDMIQNQKLTEGHARALLMIKKKDEQITLAQKMIHEKLSVRSAEKILREKSRAKKEIAAPIKTPEAIDKKLKKLIEKRKKKPIIKYTSKGGSLKIPFSTMEDLETLLTQLTL